MSGTRAGGLKARQTNLLKHGPNFYKEIGRMGGKNGHTGGFAANPGLARLAGFKGGSKSKRGRAKSTKKIIIEGKEMTKIIVRHINTKAEEVRVNYGNN